MIQTIYEFIDLIPKIKLLKNLISSKLVFVLIKPNKKKIDLDLDQKSTSAWNQIAIFLCLFESMVAVIF